MAGKILPKDLCGLSKKEIDLLIECRDEEEAIEQFRIRGYEVDSADLDAIKLAYERRNETSDANNLSLEQLEQVAGGLLVGVRRFEEKEINKNKVLSKIRNRKMSVKDCTGGYGYNYDDNCDLAHDFVENLLELCGEEVVEPRNRSQALPVKFVKEDSFSEICEAVKEHLADYLNTKENKYLKRKEFYVSDEGLVVSIAAGACYLRDKGHVDNEAEAIEASTKMHLYERQQRCSENYVNVVFKDKKKYITLPDRKGRTETYYNLWNTEACIEDFIGEINKCKKKYKKDVELDQDGFIKSEYAVLATRFYVIGEDGDFRVLKKSIKQICEIAQEEGISVNSLFDVLNRNASFRWWDKLIGNEKIRWWDEPGENEEIGRSYIWERNKIMQEGETLEEIAAKAAEAEAKAEREEVRQVGLRAREREKEIEKAYQMDEEAAKAAETAEEVAAELVKAKEKRLAAEVAAAEEEVAELVEAEKKLAAAVEAAVEKRKAAVEKAAVEKAERERERKRKVETREIDKIKVAEANGVAKAADDRLKAAKDRKEKAEKGAKERRENAEYERNRARRRKEDAEARKKAAEEAAKVAEEEVRKAEKEAENIENVKKLSIFQDLEREAEKEGWRSKDDAAYRAENVANIIEEKVETAETAAESSKEAAKLARAAAGMAEEANRWQEEATRWGEEANKWREEVQKLREKAGRWKQEAKEILAASMQESESKMRELDSKIGTAESKMRTADSKMRTADSKMKELGSKIGVAQDKWRKAYYAEKYANERIQYAKSMKDTINKKAEKAKKMTEKAESIRKKTMMSLMATGAAAAISITAFILLGKIGVGVATFFTTLFTSPALVSALSLSTLVPGGVFILAGLAFVGVVICLLYEGINYVIARREAVKAKEKVVAKAEKAEEAAGGIVEAAESAKEAAKEAEAAEAAAESAKEEAESAKEEAEAAEEEAESAKEEAEKIVRAAKEIVRGANDVLAEELVGKAEELVRVEGLAREAEEVAAKVEEVAAKANRLEAEKVAAELVRAAEVAKGLVPEEEYGAEAGSLQHYNY